MRKLLLREDIRLIGHNIIRWDIPQLERVLEIEIKARLVDTLALSWILFPKEETEDGDKKRQRHGLEEWGEYYNITKPPINDWVNLPVEVYMNRTHEDVRINTRLWEDCQTKLMSIYGSQSKIDEYLEYISFKMHCARLQEESGWKVDVDYCSKSLAFLVEEQQRKRDILSKSIPKVPIISKRIAPKKPTKADGSLSKKGSDWLSLMKAMNLPNDTEETEIITGYEDGNINSTDQIKDWLFNLGWKPTTFKSVKDKKNGGFRQVPQVNLPEGKGLCDSVKLLFEKEPSLEELDSLSVMNHRIQILQKMILLRDKDDYVQAKIKGLANTLRFQHTDPCVNLPRTDRKYAEPVRGSLIASEGFILCGADMSGLEDRLKHHFIFPYDPDYVRQMMRDDYDPHCTLAVIARMMSQDEADFYVRFDRLPEDQKKDLPESDHRQFKSLKPVRSIAKNGNYACQYGAYPPRLAITCGITEEAAKGVFDAYWELNKGIKQASAAQVVKTLKSGEMYLKNPINGFYYALRNKSDIFSTLVQGTASYVFDLWVQNILAERPQLTAQFHDEVVLEVRKGYEDNARELVQTALDKTNKLLKLNRDLGIGVQFGERYSMIH